MIGPKTPPDFAAALIQAVTKSEVPIVGTALADAFGSVTPNSRKTIVASFIWHERCTGMDAYRKWNRDESLQWISHLIKAVLCTPSEQRLRYKDEESIGSRRRTTGCGSAKRSRGSRTPLVLTGGGVEKGKAVFQAQCAKCHMHSGEGHHIGPDLTGMARTPS